MHQSKVVRYLTRAMALLIVLSVMVYMAVAAVAPVVSIPMNIAASPGSKVTIPINVTGVAGQDVGGYAIRLDYDSSVLSNPVLVKTDTLSATKTVNTFIPPADGIGKFSASLQFNFNPATDGVIFKVEFDVASGFTGTRPIQIVSDNVKSTLFSADFSMVTATWTDGSIKAVDSTGPNTSNVKTDTVTNLAIPVGTASLSLTAQISDATTGNNNIQAAEYFIGTSDGANGSGTAMTGTFTSPTVNVTAPTVNTSTWTAGSYTLRVHGRDDQGNWGATATVTVTIYSAPAAPVLTSITSPTRNTRPTMSWAAVTGAAGYDLQVAAVSDTIFSTPVLVKTGLTTTSYTPTVGEAATDGTYIFRVRAYSAAPVHAGPWAVSTALVIDTTGPSVVTNLTTTPSTDGSVQVGWTNPSADFTGVIVLAKTGSAPTFAPVNGTTYTVGTNDVVYVGNVSPYAENVPHGTVRHYAVFAYDALKNYSTGVTASATSSDSTAPSPATGFTATAGNTAVTLGWTNQATADFAGVLVLYKQGSAPTTGPTQGTAYVLGAAIGGGIVGYKGPLQTAQITGLTNNQTYYFAIYAYDERPNYSTGAAANAMPVPFGITTPTAASVDVKVGAQVAFTATGPSGSFKWTATGGTLSATTGTNVTWTAPATVATSPTSYTVTLTDGVNAALTATRTIRVFSSVGVTNKPTTAPTVQQGGKSATFTVSGGDSTLYTWTVKDSAQATIGTPQTGTSYQFTAPNVAGVYTISVTDKNGLTSDSFTVKVPFTIAPANWNLKTGDTKGFTVTGTPTATGYTWEIMDSLTATTAVSKPADYGTWTTPTPGDGTNTFTATATTSKTFYVRVTVAGIANLTDNGLDKLTVGPFNIVPTPTYTINVKDAAGVALSGVKVAVNNYAIAAQTTDVTGKVTFALPDTGLTYDYTLSKDNYVTQVSSSKDKTVSVTMLASSSLLTGNVRDGAAANLPGVKVIAYQPASYDPIRPATWYEATAVTDAAGIFNIYLPTGAAPTGWTVAADKSGYLSVSQTGIAKTPSPVTVNFTGANALVAVTATTDAGTKTATTRVNTGGGSATDTSLFTYAMVNVTVPPGALTDNANIAVSESATSAATPGSPVVYTVTATKVVGGGNAAVSRIEITLPINLSFVKPGTLESGVNVIYHAANAADLAAGKGLAVPYGNIIRTDYLGNGTVGSVTFWVNSLSAFGIGLGSGATEDKSGCFIATAAYGSYMEKHVQILRNFRDAFLLPSRVGSAFVSFYYRHSPPVANFIAQHDTLRAAVRFGLAPVVGIGYVALYTTGMQKIFIVFLMFALIAGICLIARRARRHASPEEQQLQ